VLAYAARRARRGGGSADDRHPGRQHGLAQLEILDDAGHFTWRDAPDRYWPILLDFVAKTSAH
jgi:pimeloyl-ACP methyl ester carboxylesterase